MLPPWIFKIIATKASQLEKMLCHQNVFKFQFFQLAKTLWWTRVIEYLLLGIWPISLFCIYAIYWSQTWERRPEYSTAFLDTQFA